MIDRSEEDIKKEWDMTKPLVSIRCTTYNQENYIAQCLDGFLIQKTNFPIEIIVHDDASTDSTPEIIKEYELKFTGIVKPIFEKENQYSKKDGSFTRIIDSRISGKYVACCEGDDYWCDEDKLQKQYDFMESHPDYYAVGHLTKTIDRNGKEIPSTFIDSKVGDYTENDNNRWQLFAHFSSYFFRNYNDVISKSAYDEFLRVACPGDRKYPLLFFKYGKLHVLPFVGSVYRFQSSERSFTSIKENIRAVNIYKEYYNLAMYVKSVGLHMNYRQIRQQSLLNAFFEYIRGRDSESFKTMCEYSNISKICAILWLLPGIIKRIIRKVIISEE